MENNIYFQYPVEKMDKKFDEGIHVVVVTTTGCAPCERLKKHLPALQQLHPLFVFHQYNVSSYTDTTRSWGVERMPTLVVFEGPVRRASLQHSDFRRVNEFLCLFE